MPGSSFTLICPGCAAQHAVSTGSGMFEGRTWSYKQFVCPACQTLRSMHQPDLWGKGPDCPKCGGEIEPWAGRVWLEEEEEGHIGREHVEGPCPRCGRQITMGNAADDFLIWD